MVHKDSVVWFTLEVARAVNCAVVLPVRPVERDSDPLASLENCLANEADGASPAVVKAHAGAELQLCGLHLHEGYVMNVNRVIG